jgi:hypothetical protein
MRRTSPWPGEGCSARQRRRAVLDGHAHVCHAANRTSRNQQKPAETSTANTASTAACSLLSALHAALKRRGLRRPPPGAGRAARRARPKERRYAASGALKQLKPSLQANPRYWAEQRLSTNPSQNARSAAASEESTGKPSCNLGLYRAAQRALYFCGRAVCFCVRFSASHLH